MVVFGEESDADFELSERISPALLGACARDINAFLGNSEMFGQLVQTIAVPWHFLQLFQRFVETHRLFEVAPLVLLEACLVVHFEQVGENLLQGQKIVDPIFFPCLFPRLLALDHALGPH